MLFKGYREELSKALDTVNEYDIETFCDILKYHIKHKFPIITFGNGGSSAICEHISCDFMKCIRDNNNMVEPYVINLSSNVSTMTALSNDFDYSEVYSKQIEWMPFKHALVLAISSSGNSENIVNGLKKAKEKGYVSLSMIGFDGGIIKSNNLANHFIHVNYKDYGIVEDSHHILMHYLTKRLSENQL